MIWSTFWHVYWWLFSNSTFKCLFIFFRYDINDIESNIEFHYIMFKEFKSNAKAVFQKKMYYTRIFFNTTHLMSRKPYIFSTKFSTEFSNSKLRDMTYFALYTCFSSFAEQCIEHVFVMTYLYCILCTISSKHVYSTATHTHTLVYHTDLRQYSEYTYPIHIDFM